VSREDKCLIVILRIEKGYGAKRLISEVPRKTDVNSWTVLTDINCV